MTAVNPSSFPVGMARAPDGRRFVTDPEQGTLAGDSLRWSVIPNHAGHTHVEVTNAPGSSVTFTPLTDHDADSYYEVTFTATDAAGRTDVKVIQLRPDTRFYTIESSPEGAPVEWAGQAQPAPNVRRTAIGYKPTVNAAETFTRNRRTYRFKSWSDGGARSHLITVSQFNSTLRAVYEADGVRTLRFGAVADTTVDQGYPTTSFGTSQEMVADSAPDRRGLVRFAPTGVGADTIVGARLRLFQRLGSDSVLGGLVRTVSSNDWTEQVTWPGPAVDGPQVGSFDLSRS